ncbi:uncharacterized protein B0H18DRAFT_1008410 [Fomitopsis serialis]|uniref:uncharacterized protein n=1 Tax=Fomitopsis serialis TaxID=139415 RepID=UPI002007420F|nr:uncharacterized protein B0H18DRAFT_1008410 [Neoantrodia serialis]KAH9925798.1 hypothetical protein B0H18DRAFT_1008410 [Neoantrodia serialis]
MSTTHISIKLTRPPNGLTRKVTFETHPSWDELAARIESLYDIPKEHAAVSYTDSESDDVTMNTQIELQDFYNTQSGSGTMRLVVRDIRAVRDGSGSGTGEHTTPAHQFADTIVHDIASLPGMGSNPELIERIRNAVRRSAPFWQTGGVPLSSSASFPPPPPQVFYDDSPILPGHGPWGFAGGLEPPFGRGRGGHHHGLAGAHPRHGFPPPPPGEEGPASSAREGSARAHGRRRYGPPPPSVFHPMDPQASGAFPPPPDPTLSHDFEFVHISPPRVEDVSRSPGAPPPPPQGEARLRSPGGATDEHNERRRGHGTGQRYPRYGPPPTSFDAYVNSPAGWGTYHMFDSDTLYELGFDGHRSSVEESRSLRGPPPGPQAGSSRDHGLWNARQSGESSDEI